MRLKTFTLKSNLFLICGLFFWNSAQAFFSYDDVSLVNLSSTVEAIMQDFGLDPRMQASASEVELFLTDELSRGSIDPELETPQPIFLQGNSLWEGFVWSPISGNNISYGSRAKNLTVTKQTEPFEVTDGAARRFPNYKGQNHIWMFTFFTKSGAGVRGHLHIIIVEKDISFNSGDIEQKRNQEKQNNTPIAMEQIFPNPFTDRLSIQFDNAFEGRVNLQLISMSSPTRFFIKKDDFYPAGKQQLDLDVSHLGAGAYLLRMESGNTVFHQKIIKAIE